MCLIYNFFSASVCMRV